MVAGVKMAVFWVVTPCSPAVFRYFSVTHRPDDGGSRHLRNVCKLHGAPTQNIGIFIMAFFRWTESMCKVYRMVKQLSEMPVFPPLCDSWYDPLPFVSSCNDDHLRLPPCDAVLRCRPPAPLGVTSSLTRYWPSWSNSEQSWSNLRWVSYHTGLVDSKSRVKIRIVCSD
jgi:hypothetical protein